MKFIEKLEFIRRMDQLIRLKATGAPHQFAERLGVSESSLYDLINILKDMGASIYYCKMNKTYVYKKPVTLKVGFMPHEKILSND